MAPPRDLRSRFILMMKQREIDAINQAKVDEVTRVTMIEEEIEQPPYDPLDGQRIHAWVLVAPGGKNEENIHYFLESTTGIRYELNCQSYQRIESIWNDTNYWVRFTLF